MGKPMFVRTPAVGVPSRHTVIGDTDSISGGIETPEQLDVKLFSNRHSTFLCKSSMCILCQGCPIAILGLVFWWLLLWWVFMAYPIGLLVYSSSGGFWFYVNSLDCQPLLHRLVMREAQFLKPRPDPQLQRLSSSSAASSAIRGLIPHNRGLFLKIRDLIDIPDSRMIFNFAVKVQYSSDPRRSS